MSKPPRQKLLQMSSNKSALTFVVILSLCVSIIYGLTKPVAKGGDTVDYLKLSENLVTHQTYSLQDDSPFVPTIRRAPLYPFFIAASTFGTNNENLIVCSQIIISLLSVCLFYFLAANITNQLTAFGGTVYYALYPARILSVNTILTETLFTFLLLLAVYLLFLFIKTNRQKYIIASGIIFGLSTLCRPIAMFYAVFFISVLAAILYESVFEKVKFIVLPFTLAVIAVIAPWSIRNTIVSKQFVMIQSTGPVNYYVPTRFDLDQLTETTLWPIFFNQDEYGKNIAAATTPEELLKADKTAFGLAVKNVSGNPVGYLISRAKTYPYLFINSFDNLTGFGQSFSTAFTNKNYVALMTKMGLLILFSIIPLATCLLGFYYGRKNKYVVMSGCFVFFNLIIHIPLWIEYRFWIPVFPFVVLTAIAVVGRNKNCGSLAVQKNSVAV